MIANRDFANTNEGDDGVWCQSAMNVDGIGSWKLPNGTAVSDDPSAERIHMANRPDQVGLLRTGNLGAFPYLGMYTCTIPDEDGVNQALVVWTGGNNAYDGIGGNREF